MQLHSFTVKHSDHQEFRSDSQSHHNAGPQHAHSDQHCSARLYSGVPKHTSGRDELQQLWEKL